MNRLLALTLCTLLVACGQSEDPAADRDIGGTDADVSVDSGDVGGIDIGGDAEPDADDVGMDPVDDPDVDDAGDASDVTDTETDATDTDDAGDVSDTDDASDTSDVTDADDVSDTDDVSDANDVSDADDGGMDADDGGMDADDGGMDSDVVVMPGEDPEITSMGNSNLLLRGDVMTPDGILADGEVLVVGDLITCVAMDCSGEAEAGAATVIEANGLISPGLIDSHNHLAYNFLPEWIPPGGEIFINRYVWADRPSYEAHIEPYTTYRSSNSHFCPAAEWGELRSLIHGTTTVQGQSFDRTCTDGLVRNADHSHELGVDHMRTTIGSVRDINDDDADSLVTSFMNEVTRFAVHMQEGVIQDEDDNLGKEFESFAGRDTRMNRHAGISLLGTTSILIHSMGLTEAQLMETEASGGYIVWSPSSNIVLYGETLDIETVLSYDITVGIGPDWTPSGADDMLEELSYAWAYAQDNSISVITPELLWRMATIDGAEVVGLGDLIGRIEVGYTADITIFSDRMADPYESVIEARPEDVGLVLIGGEPTYGATTLDALVSGCDAFDACGESRFVCRSADSNFATLADVETELFNILEGIGFPPEEQYGRGDELLPLVNCAR